MNNNLKEINNIINKNSSFSDFEIVSNFLSNLNYTINNLPNINISDNHILQTGGNPNFTIPKDTIMYYISPNKNYSFSYISITKKKFYVLFTPFFKLSSNNNFSNGYIHSFRVTKDISNIKSFFTNNYNIGLFDDDILNNDLNGFGLFFPKDNISTTSTDTNYDLYYCQIGLINPNEYLTFLYSYKFDSIL